MPNPTPSGYAYQPVPRVSVQPPYPLALVAESKTLFAATLEMMGQPAAARMAAGMVAAKYPAHGERAHAAAALVGVNPLDLLAAHLCYDLLLGQSGLGCSTMAVAGSDGPVLARNMDWFPEAKVARASCLVADDFGTNAGFLGMIGVVTGLSGRGFAVALNAAFGGGDTAGYPMLLFLRHVTDTAADYHDALNMVRTERLMGAGIITLVGTRNDERAVVERTPTRAAVRTPTGDEPLVATNHHRSLARPEACPRYEHLAAHAGKLPPLDVLTSPQVLQTITAQHVVMCPAKGEAEMWVPTHLLAADAHETSIAEAMGMF